MTTRKEFEQKVEEGRDETSQSFGIYIRRKFLITEGYRSWNFDGYPTWGYEAFLWKLSDRYLEEKEDTREMIADLTGKDIFKVAKQIFEDGFYKEEEE